MDNIYFKYGFLANRDSCVSYLANVVCWIAAHLRPCAGFWQISTMSTTTMMTMTSSTHRHMAHRPRPTLLPMRHGKSTRFAFSSDIWDVHKHILQKRSSPYPQMSAPSGSPIDANEGPAHLQAQQGASLPLVARLIEEVANWKPTLAINNGDIAYAR